MYIEFSHVTTHCKGFSLKDISFLVPEGFITGLVGENGAGKTTLFHQIMDENARYSGEIYINGVPLREHRQEFMQEIGFISQEQKFFKNYTPMQNVDLLKGFYDKFNCDLFCSKLEEYHVPGRNLSGLSRGEFIKFQMAFALAQVFKKEFFKELHRLIAGEDTAVFMSTHIEEEVIRHMDYVVGLSRGKAEYRKETEKWKR